MSHRNVKGATTKPTEASRTGELTWGQIMDVFTWIMAAGVPPEDGIFSVPADSWEFTIMNNNAYDYISVWVVKGYPVPPDCRWTDLFV